MLEEITFTTHGSCGRQIPVLFIKTKDAFMPLSALLFLDESNLSEGHVYII